MDEDMLSGLFRDLKPENIWLLTAIVSFLVTLAALVFGRRILPKDQGREFAVNGALSKGKARGAGMLLIVALILCTFLMVSVELEYIIYMAALFVEMMSGYLDDAAEKPWSELKKGIIDLVVSVAVSVTVYVFHGGAVYLPIIGVTFTLPAVIYVLLGVVLIWASINVTNCADGVDGLCTSLSMVTLVTVLLILRGANAWIYQAYTESIGQVIWMMLFVLAAYLWFNCSPSSMLMGDAGSRPLGMLIAMGFMISGMPFLFIPGALLLILDGGLGLLKLTVLRVTKSKTFMKNIRTPLHDHARKNKGWSDTQVVTRFTLLQLLISAAALLLAGLLP